MSALKISKKSLAGFRNGVEAVFDQIHNTGKPVMIHDAQQRDTIILGASSYRKQLEEITMLKSILKGEQDLQNGATFSHVEVMADLDRWINES